MIDKGRQEIRVTLIKSPTGYSKSQKGTIRALGLKRLNQTVVHKDTPVIRGMVAKVSHLVEINEKVRS